jgi:hypothetical protein
MTRHDGPRPDMSDLIINKEEKGSETNSEKSARVNLLEMQLHEKNKQIEDKDTQIIFLKEELTDRRDQIRGMKEIISEQKVLLETMVAPIFRALAKSVETGALNAAPIKTPSVDITPNREGASPDTN